MSQGKAVSIRITYDDGRVFGAEGEEAGKIWSAICGDVASTALRAGPGYKYTGPVLKEITGAARPAKGEGDYDEK